MKATRLILHCAQRFQCLYVRTPMPVVTPSLSVVSALVASADGERNRTDKGTKKMTGLQERQSARIAQVMQLCVAITAINDSTRDFQLSKPGKGNSTSAALARGRGRSPYASMRYSGGMTEDLSRDGADAARSEDDTESVSGSGVDTTSSPLQTLGSWAFATIAQQLAIFPDIPVGEAVMLGFPWPYYARQLTRSGAGGATTGYANIEEYHRRLVQYAEVLQHCHVYPPLLLAADLTSSNAHTHSSSSLNSGLGTPHNHQVHEPPSKKSRVSERLRALVQGEDVESASDEARGAAAARTYVRSAQLVSASGTVASIPLMVQQTCNYILQYRNVTSTTAFSGVPVVVAEAVVATAAHSTAHPGHSGTYLLKVFMGAQALYSCKSSDKGGHAGWDVAEHLSTTAAPSTVFTTEHYHVLQTMLQVHASRQHICLLGPTGCGKTAMVRAFGRLLGYGLGSTMHLYADMTHKDLFQQRMTDPKTGNTTWQDSPLLHAAIYGELVVLDGMEKLPSGMLSSLQQILVDQSAVLADGTILKSPMEYNLLKERLTERDPSTGAVVWQPTDADMQERKIFPVHPCFRVVATARPPLPVSSGSAGSRGARDFFITQDLTTLFRIVAMPDTGEDALGPVLHQVAQAEARLLQAEAWRKQEAPAVAQQRIEVVVGQLIQLRNELEELHSTDGKMPQLSLRQLRQLVRSAVRYPSRIEESVRNTLLLPLMTGVTATKVRRALEICGLAQTNARTATGRGEAVLTSPTAEGEALVAADDACRAGTEVSMRSSRLWTVNGEPVLQLSRAYTQTELALVPYVTGFHANHVQESILAWLAKQYAMGSNILLIGNQGVGKNKVVDAFLSRLSIPRHYIQLHRDTTVGSLTINPTVEAGKVVWEDSPLVKAVQRGHCLVVDEIDKAPVEVVQVLKGLIEDREMRLGDGRQIYDPAMESHATEAAEGVEDTTRRIAIHPDFRIIVLANPPGFPFHGNDFFRECGDLFAAYVMGNPDATSQLRVLTAYAPTLPRLLLERLVLVFIELQSAFTQGNLTYPFSLRELIAVVKHMSRYPQDGVYEALNNVFNFDACDENTLRVVRQVLANYLQPMIQQGGLQRLRPYKAGQPTPLLPFQELMPLPMTAMSTTAVSADAAHFTTLICLPAEVMLSKHRFLSHIVDAEEELAALQPQGNRGRSTAAALWNTTYSTESFFPASPATSASGAVASTSEAFTEWAGHFTLPFVDPSTDTVVAMTSVTAVGGAAAEVEGATLSLLSVLLLCRTPGNDSSGGASKSWPDSATPRLIVATVRLPPSSIEARYLVADKAEELATLWPVGHVRFIDVSSTYTTELSAGAAHPSSLFRFTCFNMSAQALPWCTGDDEAGDTVGQQKQQRHCIWPPSLATWSQTMGTRRSLLLRSDSAGSAADCAPQGVVLLSSTKTGCTVLIDVLASAASDLYVMRSGVAEGAIRGAAKTFGAATTTSLGPVLPLHLDRCLAAASTPPVAQAGVRVLDVSARHGAMCFAAASSTTRELLFLLRGRVVRVRFPESVVSLRFLGSRLATVEMEAAPAGDVCETSPRGTNRRTGVVKVSVKADGSAHATMLPLSTDTPCLELVEAPSAAAGDEGPTEYLSASDASSVSHGVLSPADLKGSVWRIAAASVEGSSASTPLAAVGTSELDKDNPASHNVVYARVEGIAESGLQLRYYKSKTDSANASAAPSALTTLVDDERHQLLHIHPDGRTVSAIDTQHATQRTFASAPGLAAQATSTSPAAAAAENRWSLDSRSGTVYAWQSTSQQLSVADVDGERVRQRYAEWSSLLTGNAATVGDAAAVEEGEEEVKDFKMKYSTPRKQPSGTLKHGEMDDKEHHGGNTWAGGTGGTDTAGLGGIIGPYRLDKGNPVHQVSPEEKRRVPKHLLEEARRMGRQALKERLKSIGMSEEEYEQYKGLQERVQPAVAQLRALLMGLKASEGERVWMTGQTDGVWDDKKLVEGIVGERNVYKRRVDSKEMNPFQQMYKKRLVFVLDVSASMYRFNGMDQRLTKLLETTIMIMEAFAGFESKLDYAMIGHNGDSDNIPLVDFGAPPANQKERMIICQKMLAYAQYCWSGDNTVNAMRRSVELVMKAKGDSYFVFVISDANLRQYGITPRELTAIIESKPEVKMFCIFIATLGAQASHLQQQLPAGHGYECMRTDALPQVLRQIFTSANLF
ncbi:AAA domain (dynein-related subfamily)/von Willebrand factor type A domain containing protein, putative [Leishmania tarentolae]|uniref:AAA domain (Dynein-related subfamily)/von Willebrand factor type A domain containing protein, putative n=1 Tax=Leishmania tarentolae TaxID=5689 RepID=A0A640KAP1_LEITA|nr:AAA domain (dynein-related subfamily)/von Willebrand factor type A domain containing protein, putative [Leishmania tarentolae]